jgi:hypothetical protein
MRATDPLADESIETRTVKRNETRTVKRKDFRMKRLVIFAALIVIATSLFASNTAKSKVRITVVSAEAGKLIAAEEATLNLTLASCAKKPVPKTCRTRALADHAQHLRSILLEAHLDPMAAMGGENRDCVGDTKAETEANCPNGKVQKFTVPCRPCKDEHVGDASNQCFVYICVVTTPPPKKKLD